MVAKSLCLQFGPNAVFALFEPFSPFAEFA